MMPSDRKCRLFTPEQDRFLRDNYAGRMLAELTALFNDRFGSDKTVQQIKTAVHNRGITNGRNGYFPKGHKPWNAGTKGEGLTGANIGSFKVGQVSPNRKPMWSERINAKYGFIEMKVPERNPYTGHSTRYKLKHVWVWEQAHGPVPKGHVVAFQDGNPLNCDLGNLMLLTRAELLVANMHGYKEAPAELKSSVLALAKLEAKAGIRTRPGRGRSE